MCASQGWIDIPVHSSSSEAVHEPTKKGVSLAVGGVGTPISENSFYNKPLTCRGRQPISSTIVCGGAIPTATPSCHARHFPRHLVPAGRMPSMEPSARRSLDNYGV